jgi:hypothetical protein
MRQRLEAALDYMGSPDTIASLVEECRQGLMQCWHSDNAIVFTQVANDRDGRVLNVYLAAGDLSEVLALQGAFMSFGRDQGCHKAICHGRLGWARVLPQQGWTPTALLFERPIEALPEV